MQRYGYAKCLNLGYLRTLINFSCNLKINVCIIIDYLFKGLGLLCRLSYYREIFFVKIMLRLIEIDRASLGEPRSLP